MRRRLVERAVALLTGSENSGRSRLACAALLALVAGAPACGRPSTEECNKAADHMMEIIRSSAPPDSDEVKKALEATYNDKRKDFIRMCQEQATKHEVECILQARSMDDLDKNCGGAGAK